MTTRRTAGIAGGLALALATAVSAEMGSMGVSPVQVTWPGIDTVWQHGTMYMTSDPDEEGLRYAQTQGVETVIDLMEHDEQKPRIPKLSEMILWKLFPSLKPTPEPSEADVLRELGVRYVHIPVSVEHPTEDAVRQFLAIVNEVNAQRLLVHCDIGGRALAMYAIYLGTCEGHTPEQALAKAKEAGLDHEGLEQFVLAYLTKHATQTT